MNTTQWGGLLAESETLPGFEELLQSREDLKKYKCYFKQLEEAKTLDVVNSIVRQISKYDRNYLNSKLLDELCELSHITLNTNDWVNTACKYRYVVALPFLLARHIPTHESLFIHNDIRIMKMLADGGADIHAQREKGLVFAVQNKNIKIVKFLLERGARLQDVFQECIKLAFQNRDCRLMNLLLQTHIGSDKLEWENELKKAYKMLIWEKDKNIPRHQFIKHFLAIKTFPHFEHSQK